jgi:hypothetical protein
MNEWLVWPKHEATWEYWIGWTAESVITVAVLYFLVPPMLRAIRWIYGW